MLSEIIQYTTTPCETYARKMGYLGEAIATAARYRRCKDQWSTHLNNTKSQITASISTLYKRRKALIIGVGDFNDIPVEVLAKKFKQVICVDIVFSNKAKRIIKKYNFIAHQLDITAIAEQVFHRPEVIPISDPLFFLEDNEMDFVISCNILSQLPYIPVKFLCNNSYYSDENMDDFSRQIIQSHVDYLKSFPARSLLICDTSVDVYNEDASLIESYDPLYGVTLPSPPLVKWRWNIAPIGEYRSNRSVEHEVGVFVI